eukprot:m.193581 g.193581  ORF g.193581 m.193581 type:complete len:75 (+) comp18295_c5_seq1:122-346(+)
MHNPTNSATQHNATTACSPAYSITQHHNTTSHNPQHRTHHKTTRNPIRDSTHTPPHTNLLRLLWCCVIAGTAVC